MSKYHSVKTKLDGYTFASKREANRYLELKLLLRAGAIENLVVQPIFPVIVSGKHICNYYADFEYYIDGQRVVEDVKGVKTPVYRLKKKLVGALHSIAIKEV